MRAACDRYQVHLIADEIAVGFGRTGTLFACEQAGIRADLLCLSKGLTGGYLPLSVVLTTEDIYAAFYDEYVKLNAFLHSHSYTGNALGCAAALATLEIFAQEPVIPRNRVLAQHFARSVAPLGRASPRRGGAPARHDHRHRDGPRQGSPRTLPLGGAPRPYRVPACAVTRGVLLRPIGNVIYFMPPYVIEPEHIDLMVQVAREGLELATCD